MRLENPQEYLALTLRKKLDTILSHRFSRFVKGGYVTVPENAERKKAAYS